MNEQKENNLQNTVNETANEFTPNEEAKNTSVQGEETGKKGKKEKEKLTGWPRVIKEIREWAVSLVVAIVAVFIISNYLLLPIKVDGASMNPTLTNGERLLVTVYDVKLANKLEKGDVVICNYPGRTNKDPILGLVTMDTNFVKRLVGVPGDTVSRVSGVTYINGEPLDPNPNKNHDYHPDYSDTLKSTYERVSATGETETRYIVERKSNLTGEVNERDLSYAQVNRLNLDYEYVLGEDEYFCVGDNRYNSHDSRHWNGPGIELYVKNDASGQVGPIKKDLIVGRAKFVFWPIGEAEKIEADTAYIDPADRK